MIRSIIIRKHLESNNLKDFTLNIIYAYYYIYISFIYHIDINQRMKAISPTRRNKSKSKNRQNTQRNLDVNSKNDSTFGIKAKKVRHSDINLRNVAGL